MEQVEEIIHHMEQCAYRRAGFSSFQKFYQEHIDLHLSCPIIHIAGTNGKGSTLNYLRSVLQEAGYKVGTFTSPYLETHLDRIRCMNEPISPQDFIALYKEYESIMEHWKLGSFEMDFVLALAYFKRQNCDICIMEAGIGGRFDCTNVISPCVSVVTNIGKDHMSLLGDTVEDIAWQKAGIVKTEVPFVTGEKKSICQDVFIKECDSKHASYHMVKQPYNIKSTWNDITFSYEDYKDLYIPTGAYYQLHNATCALCVLDVLQKESIISVTEAQIRKGLKCAIWLGRFEILQKKPLVIVDGAHNEEGIQALVETIQDIPDVRIIFSALKDKDCDYMLTRLCSISEDVTITSFPNERCALPKDIKKDFKVSIVEDYKEAIDEALKKDDAPLVITGSLYFISLVRMYMKEKNCV